MRLMHPYTRLWSPKGHFSSIVSYRVTSVEKSRFRNNKILEYVSQQTHFSLFSNLIVYLRKDNYKIIIINQMIKYDFKIHALLLYTN